MKNVRSLAEAGPTDFSHFGGKAFRCALMRHAGLAVPDGVVVLSEGAGRESATGELRAWMATRPHGSLFAVRSSAIAEDGAVQSFAGMHETFLNVPADEVPAAVRACWSSVRDERALAYREAHGAAGASFGMAVLVQQMIAASASGVVFTRHPVTGAGEIVINAAVGFGDALVSGLVEPDQWRIRQRDLHFLSTPEPQDRPPVLDTEQVRELCRIALRIQQLFSAPQDIEWCHDGRQFWVLQSRPITMSPGSPLEIEWTRANLREVLPDLPPPQITEYIRSVLNFAWRRFAGKLWAAESELGPILEVFYGRPYFNISQFRYTARLVGVPPARILRGLGHQQIRPEDEFAERVQWKRLLPALPSLLRMAFYEVFIGSRVRKHIGMLRRRVDFYRRALRIGLSDEVLCAQFRRINIDSSYDLRPVFALGGAVPNVEKSLHALLARVPYAYEALVPPMLAAGPKSVSSQQAFDLLHLALAARRESAARSYLLAAGSYGDYRERLRGTEFLRQFDQFLSAYGHRGVYESDWSRPRYSEDPAPLLSAIAAHVQAPSSPQPDDLLAAQQRAADEAWQRFTAALTFRQRMTLLPAVSRLIRRLQQLYIWRELYRSEIVLVAAEARKVHLTVAEGLIAREFLSDTADYFLLNHSEIVGVLEGRTSAAQVEEIIAQRRADLQVWQKLDMPVLLRSSGAACMGVASTPAADGSQFAGLCVSPGEVEAEVVVLHTASEFHRMKAGAIIVAPATDPSWTPLFTLAAGVIVEIGGLLSHASTVAREYGLPALANVRNATRLLHDGDRVRLDATNGRVLVLVRAETAPVVQV